MLTGSTTVEEHTANTQHADPHFTVVDIPNTDDTNNNKEDSFMNNGNEKDNFHCQGYLEKQLEWNVFSWQERFFVVQHNRISYTVPLVDQHNNNSNNKFIGFEKKSATIISLDYVNDNNNHQNNKSSKTSKNTYYYLTIWLLEERNCWKLRTKDETTFVRFVTVLTSRLKHVLTKPQKSNHSESNNAENEKETYDSLFGKQLFSVLCKKKSFWKGKWNNRFLDVYEHLGLIYYNAISENNSNSNYKKAEERGRYTIVSADISYYFFQTKNDDNRHNHIFIVCSDETHFWIKIKDKKDCFYFYSLIKTRLNAFFPFQFCPVFSSQFLEKFSSTNHNNNNNGSNNKNKEAFRVHYHGATAVPSQRYLNYYYFNNHENNSNNENNETLFSSPPRVISYGGVSAICEEVLIPQNNNKTENNSDAKLFNILRGAVPRPPAEVTSDFTVTIQGSNAVQRSNETLKGNKYIASHYLEKQNKCRAFQAALFLEEEGEKEKEKNKTKKEDDPNNNINTTITARRSPPARYGCTLLSLLPHHNNNNITMLMYGGFTAGTIGNYKTELWSQRLSNNTNNHHHWSVEEMDATVLPQRTFHDSIELFFPNNNNNENNTIIKDYHAILIAGGCSDALQYCSECFLLLYPRQDNNENNNKKPFAKLMGHLPHTRSFLQLTSLKNGTVICVGGRSLRDPNSEQNEKYKKNETAILTMTSSHYHAFLQEEDHNNNNNSKACCWETVEWINTTKNEYYFPHSLHQCVVDVTSKDVLVILTENEPNYVSNNHKNENNNEDDHEDSRSSCTPLPCTHLQLFLVEFSDSNNYNNKQKASWREVILQLGSIPYSIRGASLHIISNLIHHNNSNSHETDFSIYLFGSYNNFNANGSLEMLTDKKKLKEYYFKSEKERQVNLPIRIRYEE